MPFLEPCQKCGYTHWHTDRCLAKFYFQHENWGDEFQEIGAYDFEDAARRFAEKYDEDDHPLLNDGSAVVLIRHGDETKPFRVSAEPAIDYHYDEITMAEYEKEAS